MISEGSCDTEVMAPENVALPSQEKLHVNIKKKCYLNFNIHNIALLLLLIK